MNPDPASSAPPIDDGAVWPPPPLVSAAVSPAWRPFRFVYKRLEGNLSDLREGAVAAGPDGISLSGKAQPRSETFWIVTIPLFLINPIFSIIAACIMRYGCLKPMNLQVSWLNVRRVVSDAKRRTIGIVYEAPNYVGAQKTFCLAFSLSTEDFDAFLDTSREYAPDRTGEGKFKPGISVLLIIMLVIAVAVIIIGVIGYL